MKNFLKETYNPNKVEQYTKNFWEKERIFYVDENNKKNNFTIILPPPNVTGNLHIGHAWDSFIQDTIARYKRMQGYNVLFLPGIDHAGIATQAKVEEILRKQNIQKENITREEFIKKIWDWKEKYSLTIREQWKKMCLSLDYSKEKFTMDKSINLAVKKVFFDLYNKGLIYRGKKIINYDTKLKTPISNIEVIFRETSSQEYYIEYKLVGILDSLLVMTTRPETIFGDVALAVHPTDERYKRFIGKMAFIPIIDKKIPIIADEYIDKSKGTGVVKITPAHDINDFEVASRHNIKGRNIINIDGTMSINDLVPKKYQGIEKLKARELIINCLRKNKILKKTKEILHSVGYSERTNTPIETLLSTQWFLKTKELAKKALKDQETNNTIKFYPEKFNKVFQQWSNNLQDWCISRNILWGHQIPAWYNKKNNDILVSISEPDIDEWKQDECVLDTWFSSTIWPFASLGWPDLNNPLFKNYYPTDVLVSGYDIIYFWISRMIYQSYENLNLYPFKDVLIHGLVRDSQGRKMSKSLNNGIDPMDVIDTYGCDSLRFFLLTTTTPGLDINYNENRVLSNNFFINKIWNATKFILLKDNINCLDYSEESIANEEFDPYDTWLFKNYYDMLLKIRNSFDKYEFSEVGKILYNFIWNIFCNWYLEFCKFNYFKNLNTNRKTKILYFILKKVLLISHPFLPNVTEYLWQQIPGNKNSISKSKFPKINNVIYDKISLSNTKNINIILEIITDIRKLRTKYKIGKKPISLNIQAKNNELKHFLEDNVEVLRYFCYLEDISFSENKKNDITKKEHLIYSDLIIYVYGLHINNKKEEQLKDLLLQKKQIESEVLRSSKILSNKNFVNKAPEKIVKEEKIKADNYKEKLKNIIKQINNL